jgi:ATP-dependent DNA helicase RecG
MSAEKFGLAALHQIRGRVGRNDYQTNECILVTSTVGATFSHRLKYLVDSNDGFFLAQKDLELRGSGSLFGTEQSGFEGDFGALMRLPAAKLQELHAVIRGIDLENPQFSRLKIYAQNQLQQAWKE